MKLEGEQTLMRIFIGESDRWKMKPLHEALVEMFRREGFAGATVHKGIMGFGCHSVTHTDKLLRFSADLPIIVEVVDSAEKIQEIMPRIDDMMDGGMITLETTHVIRYRKDDTSCCDK
jgi:PII-like signaling protein